jgi:hypothetical protein
MQHLAAHKGDIAAALASLKAAGAAASCADRWVWFRNHELLRTLDEERGALLSDIRH